MVDRKLRRRFRDGDPEAVRSVYREYGRLVFAVALKVLGDHSLAEEATQQTFVKAWQAAGSLDEHRELDPWLATIARRVAIDIYRREKLRRADPLESAAPGDPALVSAPESAGAVYDVWEVRRAVSALPRGAGGRSPAALRGPHPRQIADRLKLPPGTVKSRSFRAHRRLAGELGHLRE